jgi:hypothetical protein
MIPRPESGLPILESLPILGGRRLFAACAADIVAGDSVHQIEAWVEFDGGARSDLSAATARQKRTRRW